MQGKGTQDGHGILKGHNAGDGPSPSQLRYRFCQFLRRFLDSRVAMKSCNR